MKSLIDQGFVAAEPGARDEVDVVPLRLLAADEIVDVDLDAAQLRKIGVRHVQDARHAGSLAPAPTRSRGPMSERATSTPAGLRPDRVSDAGERCSHSQPASTAPPTGISIRKVNAR